MLADDIVDLLSTGGVASASLYIGEAPEKPHTAMVVTPTGGVGPVRTMSATPANAPLEYTRIQLRARATDAATAEALLMSGHVILSGFGGRSINGRRYYCALAVQSPFYLGRDELSRALYACNYDVLRAEATA